MTVDIYSGGEYPANALSNFAKHPFSFRGFIINSMEGFISGLTHKDPIEQMKVFLLHGIEAKHSSLPWEFNQTVYWQGTPIKRYSQEYQDLFDEAYDALYTNTEFKKALIDTGAQPIKHTMGCKIQSKTLLTEKEFVDRVIALRNYGTCKKAKYTQDELF